MTKTEKLYNEVITELLPNDSHKSFYGKAKVISNSNGVDYLKSYDTLIAMIDQNGKLRKLSDAYSATTGRHIKAFCLKFGFNAFSKKEWEALDTYELADYETGLLQSAHNAELWNCGGSIFCRY